MSDFAETLTAQQRKRARIYAYVSGYFGCISEVMLDSSAIIIVYIGMLGGGSTLEMLSTSLTGISCMLLLIPSAVLVKRIGMKKAAAVACLTGCVGYLLMAAAPFFTPYSRVAVMIGCLLYCLQRSLFGTVWYPMVDAFLLKEDRGSFFGTLRYSYMIVSGILFYLLGKLMGKNPPLLLIQIVLAVTGLLILGRLFCMLRFPENTREEKSKLNFKYALGISICNSSLTGYAIYICLLSIAYSSLIPLTLIYLKQHVGLPAGPLQIFSTIGIAGSIIGYFCYGFLLKKWNLKGMELITHFIFILTAFAMFLLPKDMPYFLWLAGIAYFLTSFGASTYLCNSSTEMLALAPPGNKPMTMAFQQTYQYIGMAIGRTGTSLILGLNLLAPVWNIGSISFSFYQTLFLLYGVIAAVCLLILPILPAIVTKHHDYYDLK